MLTPYSPKTGLYWPPVVARVGRRPWRCRCGLPHWWPPVLADAVAVRRGGVRPCGWCTGWRSLPLVSVRRAGGRSVAGVRPWPWWPFPWPLATFRPSAGPLVRRGPFVAVAARFWALPVVRRDGVRWPCVLALHLVVFRRRLWPVAAGVRCWSLRALCAPSAVAVAVSLAVLAGVAGVGVIAPCRGPWPVSLAASVGRRVAVCWWCHCAVPCWVVCRVRPSVLVSAVAVAGRVRPSLLVCWCAVGGWRPFLAVFRGRGGPFGPSVVLVSVAGPCGPCGPCFGPCRLAGRVGLASGWRRWLAVLALAVVLALSKSGGPWLAGGGPCAVLPVVVASACLACGPCWCRTSGGRGRPSNQRTNTSGRRGGLAGGVVLLACAGVGGAGVGGHVLAPVGPRAAAVGRRAVGVAYRYGGVLAGDSGGR